MMTCKKWWTLGVGAILALGLVTVGGTAAVAAGHRGGHGPGALMGGPMRGFMGDLLPHAKKLRGELKLTDEQRGTIRETLKKDAPQIQEAMKQVKDANRKLDDAVRAEKTDEAAIRAAAENVGKALGEASLVRAKVLAEMRPVLTAEQLKKIDAFRNDVRGMADKAIDKLPEAAK